MADDKKKNTMAEEDVIQEKEVLTNKVPLLPLRSMLVFPYTLAPLVIEGDEYVKMIDDVSSGDRLIASFPEVDDSVDIESTGFDFKIDTIKANDRVVSRIGTVARIVKMLRFPDGTVRVLVRGLKRVRITKVYRNGKVMVENVPEEKGDDLEAIAMARNALKQFQEIISYSPNFPEELKIAILNVSDNFRLVDLIADTLNLSFVEKLCILTLPSLHDRFPVADNFTES